MAMTWSKLTEITRGVPFVVERVRLTDSGVALEGEFEVPTLMALSAEDLVFVEAFVKSHGSIKEMERLFGVSYPTVKNRLNRLSGALGGDDVEVTTEAEAKDADVRAEVLARVATGEITADEAVRQLTGGR